MGYKIRKINIYFGGFVQYVLNRLIKALIYMIESCTFNNLNT